MVVKMIGMCGTREVIVGNGLNVGSVEIGKIVVNAETAQTVTIVMIVMITTVETVPVVAEVVAEVADMLVVGVEGAVVEAVHIMFVAIVALVEIEIFVAMLQTSIRKSNYGTTPSPKMLRNNNSKIIQMMPGATGTMKNMWAL